jgi:predicted ATPase
VPAVDWITIRNFRSIRSIERFALSNVNVLIGPNGAGKSNLIGALSFLQDIRAGQLSRYVARAGGAARILHFGGAKDKTLELEVSFADEVNQYRIALVSGAGDLLLPVDEEVRFWNKQHPSPCTEQLWRHGAEAGISMAENGKVAAYVRARLASWRLYHFHDTSATATMKQSAAVDDNRFLRPDGGNLAAFLYLLRVRHESSFRLIESTIRNIAPFFERFVLEPSALDPTRISLEWKQQQSDAHFGAAELSDGTLRFMLLATLFLQPVSLQPSLILVDEPELGLHPTAITNLAELIQHAAASRQVLISTQSATLLDSFAPEDVLVAEQRNGEMIIRRLEAAAYAEWMDEYSLGQLWGKNYLGGRPA